jgi:hypothetical protein
VGGLLADERAERPPAAVGSAIGLPEVNLAVQAQQLQSALAAYAVAAEAIRTPADARTHGVQLERHEETLAEVARSAGRLAANERGRAPAAAERHLALKRGTEGLRAKAIALREAAQSETEGGDGVLALGTFAGGVQKKSARLQSLLTVLTAAADAPTYFAALSAIEREIAGINPGESPGGQGDDGPVGGDDPVP